MSLEWNLICFYGFKYCQYTEVSQIHVCLLRFRDITWTLECPLTCLVKRELWFVTKPTLLRCPSHHCWHPSPSPTSATWETLFPLPSHPIASHLELFSKLCGFSWISLESVPSFKPINSALTLTLAIYLLSQYTCFETEFSASFIDSPPVHSAHQGCYFCTVWINTCHATVESPLVVCSFLPENGINLLLDMRSPSWSVFWLPIHLLSFSYIPYWFFHLIPHITATLIVS